MIFLIKTLFFLCLFLFIYTYLIFPFLVFIIYRFKTKLSKPFYKFEELPLVSCIISVFNEEKLIGPKIQSLLNSNYPKDKLNIFIGSDHSNDQSNAIISQFALTNNHIFFYPFNERRGKTRVINDLVKKVAEKNTLHANHIILCTDANVMLEKNTIEKLCRNYINSQIGLVDTRIIPGDIKNIGVSKSENNYIQLETKLKHWEGELWGCMMGAFGGCYSLRSNLMHKIPDDVIADDFYISLKVLESGYSCINDLEAIAHEALPGTLNEEFRRKSRISSGNFQNLSTFKHLIWSSPVSRAICFLSHKVLRWKSPFLILLCLIFSFILSICVGGVYLWIFGVLSTIFVLIPFLDKLMSSFNINNYWIRSISYFVWMNLALIKGFINYCIGIKTSIWHPTERN